MFNLKLIFNLKIIIKIIIIMCGICAFVGNKSSNIYDKRKHFLELSKRIRHRGPDWNGIYIDDVNNVVICHERLSIVGVEHGSQPIVDNDEYILSVNGEIYNYKQLYDTVLHNKYKPQTDSDCEIIIHLYKEYGPNCVKMLDGIFSFVLYDKVNRKILVARDPIGVIPLYYGITADNDLMIASEMKCLIDDCDTICLFPPSHYYSRDIETEWDSTKLTKYFDPNWDTPQFNTTETEEALKLQLKSVLFDAVDKRLMTDVPFGVLLSGGLDSSLIAAITSRLLKSKPSVWGKLHTFSIGLEGAPDLKYARKVADFLGTIHHEFHFTVQEGIDALEDLIWHLETYDVTTIRASTPMFLLSRLIKSMGIKMVLSGEGADEILGGYLYFHNAPNSQEFHSECVSRVKGLHNFDCLRANKSTMSWGLEARVPFLDQSFMELAIPIDPELKCAKRWDTDNKIEKYILRKAFEADENGEPYLPDDILWRQKEQFSDGVGYNWIDGLKEFIETQITDEEFKDELKDTTKYKDDIPKNKEELYYRRIFDRLFPGRHDIVPRWIPKTDWEGVGYDPSGRAQGVHAESNI
jgi:asparagine synthase (glutamine-hydrolysing)